MGSVIRYALITLPQGGGKVQVPHSKKGSIQVLQVDGAFGGNPDKAWLVHLAIIEPSDEAIDSLEVVEDE